MCLYQLSFLYRYKRPYLVRIVFSEKVSVTGINFRCDEPPKFATESEGGDEGDEDFKPPFNVKVFTGQDSLDFSDIEDYKVGWISAILRITR